MAKAVAPKSVRTIADLRADFPTLAGKMSGKPVAYLDTGASAQKPQAVIDAMKDVMESHYANIHRGLYEFSQTTTTEYEAVRAKVAGFIGAGSENEVIFTRNTTEAINLVAHSWGRRVLERGDDVIITEMEHHANIVPWQLVCGMTGAKLKVVPVNDDGTLNIAAFEHMVTEKTKIVSFVHISNSLGTINPAKKIVEICKAKNPNVTVLIDGSQSAVHGPVNVQDLGCDFFAFTGHKLYGPTGVGVLWAKAEILEQMPPYQGGGDMIEQVTFAKTTFKEAPAKFEAGTPAIVEVIGLGAAIDYVQGIGMDVIAAHEKSLFEYAMKELAAIPGLTYYGTGPDKAGIISFRADWGHPSDIGMILDQCGVAVRTGHHCCQPLMQRFGVEATVRASLGLYSDENDIDALVDGLHKARSLLG
ncbi:MAG: cysteine desulfurase [Micavibrio aeruginosavorus]|uniref:Cysteine desulfurase n=1 Tax=Micavibrio aeruginosavorus TaxID=349221 RepID=A0A7T5R178_9BACT|nr:MAG: cysteine desulfurase [Micavibrio aeruginosavorus]